MEGAAAGRRFDFSFHPGRGLYLPPQSFPAFDQNDVSNLRHFLEEGEFAKAEFIARKVQAGAPHGSPLSASASYLLAQTLFAAGKIDAAIVQMELAVEIRKLLRRGFDVEALLLDVLAAEILERKGKDEESLTALGGVIKKCERHGLISELHIPLIKKSLILTKLDRLSEVRDLLEHYLPVLREQPDDQYRDELRRFWQAIAERGGQEVSEIVRLILSKEIKEELSKPQTENFIPASPEKWELDAVSNFLQIAENNTLSTFRDNASQFQSLVNIEARLRVTAGKSKEVVIMTAHHRLQSDFSLSKIEPADWLETFFLLRAHTAFLGAVRLGTSAQYAETLMVLRGALENAMYCFAVATEPWLKQVWFDKYKDKSSLKRFRHRFSIDEISNVMTRVSVRANEECSKLYAELIDLGGHPNEATLQLLGSGKATTNSFTVSVDGLQPALLERLLDTCIDVGILILELLALAMPGCTAAPPRISVPHDEISSRAYLRWLRRGQQHGRHLEDWLRAEAELRLCI